MTDVICLSILQTEINSGFEGLQVTTTIRYRDIAVHCKHRTKLEYQEAVFNRMEVTHTKS